MIETHAHLDSKKYDPDRNEVIKRAFESGVEKIINISSEVAAIERIISIAENNENIYATAGIQPHNAYEFDRKIMERIIEMANGSKIVAIGEVGLDYHYNFSLPEIQRKVFRRQINIARELNLPLVIHTREAFSDTIKILKEEKAHEVGGVIHCFTDDKEKAKEFIKLGFYIGIGGAVTFKNTKVLQETAKEIPLDRIVLETDCPYMTPTPHRGKRNEPSYLEFVARKIGDLKNISTEEVKKETTVNAINLFKLS